MNNIIFAGVGGQGLVLTTHIVTQVGMAEGYDVKSNDVVGLAQRGGTIWGSVRIGDKVYSPNIPPGQVDFLVAYEPLEALRWQTYVNKDSLVILNTQQMAPTLVLMEKEPYPPNIEESFAKRAKIVALNATDEGRKLGNIRVANTILLGILARHLSFAKKTWEDIIAKNVPPKTIDLNSQAFDLGYKWQDQT